MLPTAFTSQQKGRKRRRLARALARALAGVLAGVWLGSGFWGLVRVWPGSEGPDFWSEGQDSGVWLGSGFWV